MDPLFIDEFTIDGAWHSILFNMEKAYKQQIDAGSFQGSNRIQLPFLAGWIRRPATRPLAVQIPEGLGISPPTTEEDIEEYFVNYLMNPEKEDNEEYKYAEWINEKLINIKKTDPPYIYISVINWIIQHFKEKGFGTNHCCLTIGDNHYLTNYDESPPGSTPCLKFIDFKINGNKLILFAGLRSWDIWSGFPVNIGGLQLLSEYVAQELGIDSGPLAFASAGAHLYDYQMQVYKQRTYKE
jgi:thymidylate synthase